MLFISDAFSQEAANAVTVQEPSALAGLLPILLILVVFYFLLIRPQQKKYKEHVELVNGIAKGDTVITSGGIIGKVTKVDSDKELLHVQIADGVEVKVVRSTVSAIVDEKGQSLQAGAKQVAGKEEKASKSSAKKSVKSA